MRTESSRPTASTPELMTRIKTLYDAKIALEQRGASSVDSAISSKSTKPLREDLAFTEAVS